MSSSRPALIFPVVILALLASLPAAARDDSAAESLGWHLALQAWTYNDLTTFETIDKAKAFGVRYIELFPGQKLRPDSDVKTDQNLPADERDRLIAKLKEAGVKAVAYGVIQMGVDEANDRKIFEFAKALGMEEIDTEAFQEQLERLEKLAKQYDINVALHNHAKPSRYWDPQIAYAAVKALGPKMGLCADTGHWMRSGIEPVDALRKYGARVLSLHFKDLNEFGQAGAQDVPWGTGAGKVKEVLAVLKEIKFKGTIAIEYEHKTGKLDADVAECVASFDKMAAELTAKKK